MVVGEKGKAAAEFYDANKVRREYIWAKEWQPKLVKTSYVCYSPSNRLQIRFADLVAATERSTSTRPSLDCSANHPSWLPV